MSPPWSALRALGVLEAVDEHVAVTLGALVGEAHPDVLLVVALATRASRSGHVASVPKELFADAAAAAQQAAERREDAVVVAFPVDPTWEERLRASPLVACPIDDHPGQRLLRGPAGDHAPFVLDRGRLYLERLWQAEVQLARRLTARARASFEVDVEALRAALDLVFPEATADPNQAAASVVAQMRGLMVLTGGPGTGKTTTVAGVLAVLCLLRPGLRVQLVAPTGKAAARMGESMRHQLDALRQRGVPESVVSALPTKASTLHRALGYAPFLERPFRRDAENPLAADVVVVDEASMVDLDLMARLEEAVRDKARLILVGDRDQLVSVEAGVVLADLTSSAGRAALSSAVGVVRGSLGSVFAGSSPVEASVDGAGVSAGSVADVVVHLRRTFRHGGAIGALAAAVREGHDPAPLLSGDEAWLIEDAARGEAALRRAVLAVFAEVVGAATDEAALRALDGLRVLCALRDGPRGVSGLNARILSWLVDAGLAPAGRTWWSGRPILILRNDPGVGLWNGDVGVVRVDDKGPKVVFPGDAGKLLVVYPARLPEHDTMFAMTVHRSQGSEFERVMFVLPDRPSPILTRELVYTAVTRARREVGVLGSAALLRRAVGVSVRRASGLADRLTAWGVTTGGPA
jgi:exodeoxyribonuclease V alpha subunit